MKKKKKMRIIIFRDSMKSALQRGISYLEAVENKKQYADVMAELTEEEEEEAAEERLATYDKLTEDEKEKAAIEEDYI